MTLDIALVLGILLVAVVLFVTGRMRVDLVALLVLGALAITGLVTPVEAFAGFSSPAVIMVAAMFVISAALARTGVAGIIGRQVLRVGGRTEVRLVVTIMATAAALSSVMNNVGVVALMLPVVMDIARRTSRAPSRLLIPLVLAAHLGGITTLIGTPPNILASDALRDAGLAPFELLDFTPVGLLLLAAGILYVATAGRRILPRRGPDRPDERGAALKESLAMEERLFHLRVPARSLLNGRTLADSRLGSALGLRVLAIRRGGDTTLAPGPADTLRGGDRLLVQGRTHLLEELRGRRHLVLEQDRETAGRLVSDEIGVAEARVAPESPLAGLTLNESALRYRLGIIVLAYRRDGVAHRTDLQDTPLRPGDRLLVQGPHDRIAALPERSEFDAVDSLSPEEVFSRFRLDERFLTLRITENSLLVDRPLAESRLGDAAGLTVLGIIRDGKTRLIPKPQEVFRAGDVLLAKANPEDLAALRGLQKLEVEPAGDPDLESLESRRVGMLEVVLSPRSTLAGKTLRQASFRDKYGIDVLAIWRGGSAHRSDLRDTELRYGDALLLFGRRDKLRMLADESDFLVLTSAGREPPDTRRAPVATAILMVALALYMVAGLAIEVALVLGATAMVLTRCLPMDDAYRAMEWRALILIAGMLPLGTALGNSGAAALVAEGVIGTAGPLGPRAVLAGLCLVTVLGAQVIPTSVLVVLMAPIALSTAADLGLSPQGLMMGVALSAMTLASPVAHPANVLVMGPGGYRYADYLRVGLPLTGIVLLLIVLFVPVVFPL